MLLVKNWLFFRFIILGFVGQENVFYDILERKKPFLGYKNKKFKQSKIEIFANELDQGFCQQLAIFPFFF